METFSQKKTGEVQIKMCDYNGKPFIAIFYNLLSAPDLCDWLLSIILFMNLGNNCIFHKGFCMVLFSENEKNVVTLPHSAQWKQVFLLKIKEKSKSQKQISKN